MADRLSRRRGANGARKPRNGGVAERRYCWLFCEELLPFAETETV
jgi:hypothetical protein